MAENQIIYILVSSVVASAITGALSAASTIIALRVHIDYIKEAISHIRSELDWAHRRIDTLSTSKPPT